MYYEQSALPFAFEWKDDTDLRRNEYDGYIVVEVGSIPVEDLYRRFLTQFSYEMESWARHSFASRLNRGEYLAFVGVDTQTDIPLVLEKPDDGSRITATFKLSESAVSNEEGAKPNFEYSIDSSAGIGIFTLHQCVFDDEYKNGLRDFFTAAEENNIQQRDCGFKEQSGRKLACCKRVYPLPAGRKLSHRRLRRSFGPIVWKNKPQRQKNQQLHPVFSGDVYILTGEDSFSSAMDFATLISDNKLGTVVGEIPGNMPSSYGDNLYFQTPNARLVFTVSYKYFIRPDASKSDSPLIPDVMVPAKDALTETMRLIEKGNQG